MLAVFRGVRNCFHYRDECFGEVKNNFFKIINFCLLTTKHCFLGATFKISQENRMKSLYCNFVTC